jgi:hypothetical protein
MILPRQARDKHRESTQKESGVSLGGAVRAQRDGEDRRRCETTRAKFWYDFLLKTRSIYQDRLRTNIGKRRFVADYCLDVHGDEGHPYNYVVCCPAWTERLNSLQDMFWSEWRASCPDFSPASSDKVMELGAVETLFFRAVLGGIFSHFEGTIVRQDRLGTKKTLGNVRKR